jgi:heat shock protein HslJ
MGGVFSVKDTRITFSDMISTKMYCEGVQDTEDSFFKQLGKVNRFKLKDKNLVFYHGDDILLEFQSE